MSGKPKIKSNKLFSLLHLVDIQETTTSNNKYLTKAFIRYFTGWVRCTFGFWKILVHTFLFSNFIGKLVVLPNGDVYSNCNNSKLGNVNTDTIGSIVNKELNSNKAWRKIRKDLQPCKNCLFSYLCPPVSNYELILKTNNLCNVLLD